MLDTYLTYLYIYISVVFSNNVYIILSRIYNYGNVFNNEYNDTTVTWHENPEITHNATVASISSRNNVCCVGLQNKQIKIIIHKNVNVYWCAFVNFIHIFLIILHIDC